MTYVSKCVEGRMNDQILGVERLTATFWKNKNGWITHFVLIVYKFYWVCLEMFFDGQLCGGY